MSSAAPAPPIPAPAVLSRCVAVLLALLCAAPFADSDTTWYAFDDEPKYRNVFARDPRLDSKLLPININNHWGLTDQRGVIIALPRFDWTDYGYDGLARAMLDGKTGFIVGDGDWYIPPTFDWVDRFENDFAVFRHRGRYGFIDQRGRVKLKPEAEGLLRFREQTAVAMLGGKVGYLNRNMEWTIPPRFASARSFHDGRAAVQYFTDEGVPGNWGFIDRRGEPLWTDDSGRVLELGDYNDGRAKVLVGSAADDPSGEALWGYLDQRYELVIQPRFRSARDFTDEVAAVELGSDGWGYIRRDGSWTITPQFDDADDFDDRLAMIRHNGLYGYIDKAGRTGLYPQFRGAEPFLFGYARVARDQSFAYVHESGYVLWDPLVAQRRIVRDTLVDATAGAQIQRQVAAGDTVERYLYRKIPEWRPQAPIPYEPEFRYEEKLPPPPRGGLIEVIEDADDTDVIERTEPTETLKPETNERDPSPSPPQPDENTTPTPAPPDATP